LSRRAGLGWMHGRWGDAPHPKNRLFALVAGAVRLPGKPQGPSAFRQHVARLDASMRYRTDVSNLKSHTHRRPPPRLHSKLGEAERYYATSVRRPKPCDRLRAIRTIRELLLSVLHHPAARQGFGLHIPPALRRAMCVIGLLATMPLTVYWCGDFARSNASSTGGRVGLRRGGVPARICLLDAPRGATGVARNTALALHARDAIGGCGCGRKTVDGWCRLSTKLTRTATATGSSPPPPSTVAPSTCGA
jgi:hypothetical protein